MIDEILAAIDEHYEAFHGTLRATLAIIAPDVLEFG